MFILWGVLSLLPVAKPITAPINPPAIQAQQVKHINPAIEMMGKLVGGTWRNTGPFVIEFTYEWRVKGQAIRGIGVMGKGDPMETPSESLYGWDAEKKKVYYLDFHGANTVYSGLCGVKDGKFQGDFMGLIGDKGHYRFETQMPDNDTYTASVFAMKDNKWVELHTMTFKRHR